MTDTLVLHHKTKMVRRLRLAPDEAMSWAPLTLVADD